MTRWRKADAGNQMNFYLPSAVSDEIRAVAAHEGVPMSHLVARAWRVYMDVTLRRTAPVCVCGGKSVPVLPPDGLAADAD